MGETVQYETRKKDTQLEKKTRNTNKICETRIKGAKFEENVQNTNENMKENTRQPSRQPGGSLASLSAGYYRAGWLGRGELSCDELGSSHLI